MVENWELNWDVNKASIKILVKMSLILSQFLEHECSVRPDYFV